MPETIEPTEEQVALARDVAIAVLRGGAFGATQAARLIAAHDRALAPKVLSVDRSNHVLARMLYEAEQDVQRLMGRDVLPLHIFLLELEVLNSARRS